MLLLKWRGDKPGMCFSQSINKKFNQIKILVLHQSMLYFSDGGDNSERVHRQPGHGRPAPLSLHHPPHSYRPRQQVLGTGSWHGKAFKDSRVKTNARQNKTLIKAISKHMLRSMCASLWRQHSLLASSSPPSQSPSSLSIDSSSSNIPLVFRFQPLL